MSKRVSSTDRNELVETHNIALALQRLKQPPHDDYRWKRALYHALGMSNVCYNETTKKVREALELP